MTGNSVVFIAAHKVKNPNWPEVNQLIIYKGDRRVKLRTTENKSSWRLGRGLNSGLVLAHGTTRLREILSESMCFQ